jgi:hypothetical protein
MKLKVEIIKINRNSNFDFDFRNRNSARQSKLKFRLISLKTSFNPEETLPTFNVLCETWYIS